MKQFPKEQQEQNKMVIPQTVNTNPSQYENETNGGLNGQNMPVNDLTHLKFVAPTQSTTTSSNERITKWEGQTQQYREVSRYAHDFAADQFTALVNYDLKTSDWNKGWNRLEEITNFDDVILSMDCKEGMLNGCASINFRHGFNVVSDTVDYVTGLDWWTRWGIFINDTLIAETDTCYPRLENLVIPFSVPVGTQSIRIDLRWKTYTTTAVGGGFSGDPTTDLEIFGAAIWARNTYR